MPRAREQHYTTKLIDYSYLKTFMTLYCILYSINLQNWALKFAFKLSFFVFLVFIYVLTAFQVS